MKQSQRRHFNRSGCDCRDCAHSSGFRQFGYALMVLVILILTFASLFVIAEALGSTQIVK
jgi:hypothetical protein